MPNELIFDTHTHVFPDKIAEKVITHLRELSKGIPAYTNGCYGDLEKKAKEAGYAGWMNCPVVTRAGQAEHLNQWAAEHNHWPSLSLGGLHPEDEHKTDIVRHIKELGLYGLKFHPEYQGFYLLDHSMDEVWEACVKFQLPVLFHAGEDIGFEPPYHSAPADFAELKRRHPQLTIVAAHTGGWNLWDKVEKDLAGADLYIDTSFTYPFLKDKSQFLRIIRKHGTKKVLFGTDSPWMDLQTAVQQLRECGLTTEELQDIFWNNAKQLWKF